MLSEDVIRATGIQEYFSLFTGHFGQDGNPMFSNITVSTDNILVKTYEVNTSGIAEPFDEFKIVK